MAKSEILSKNLKKFRKNLHKNTKKLYPRKGRKILKEGIEEAAEKIVNPASEKALEFQRKHGKTLATSQPNIVDAFAKERAALVDSLPLKGEQTAFDLEIPSIPKQTDMFENIDNGIKEIRKTTSPVIKGQLSMFDDMGQQNMFGKNMSTSTYVNEIKNRDAMIKAHNTVKDKNAKSYTHKPETTEEMKKRAQGYKDAIKNEKEKNQSFYEKHYDKVKLGVGAAVTGAVVLNLANKNGEQSNAQLYNQGGGYY